MKPIPSAMLPALASNPRRHPAIVLVLILALGLWGLAAEVAHAAAPLPTLVVTADDTQVTQSCEIVIPPGTVLADANTNGVLHVAADNLTIRFAPGSELRGAAPGTPWDTLKGIGIRLDGHRHVRLFGARVHGFFNGLVATHADDLVVDGGDFSDNYRQHLGSTPQAEDGADWLFPHNNDETRWRDQYGGALCIESSKGVSVSNVRIRRGQNGIILDRVDDSRVFDNDCSFLSGWGLALWRSSRNTISRNAFDFCVRGHVEGVYNRGQDSAGILCFEQCNENVIAANSVTHGGDGFFGFAGREALGEFWMEAERQRLRRETGREDVEALIRIPPEVARDFSARGCNRNLLVGNDFSYAPAHGIEMTFGEGNVFARNRLVENAICGIWGGYSSDSLIVENEFAGNGGMAYGLERGGINMEHASGNRILRNTFTDNKCAIHLWWDNDAALIRSPGVAGTYRGVSGNVVADNTFVVTPDHPFRNLRPTDRLIVLQLRDDGTNNVHDNLYLRNQVRLGISNAVEFAVKPGSEPVTRGRMPSYRLPRLALHGRHEPVGARPHLRGRHQILLDEWGPWDHESPLLRPVTAASGERIFEILGLPSQPRVTVEPATVTPALEPIPARTNAWRLTLRAPSGVTAFHARLQAPDFDRSLDGTLIATRWECVFFPWKPETDPREHLAEWRQLASGPEAIRTSTDALDLPYGGGGPRDLGSRLGDEVRRRGPGSDHFGMIARTRLQLPRGNWRIATLSDDGIRVTVAGRKVLENWGWHGPTRDEGTFTQGADGEVEVEVEHFEIDGYSVLRLDLEPAKP